MFYFDSETTGLDCSKHSMWQMAWIIEIDGKVVDSANVKMQPIKEREVDIEAFKKTNNMDSWSKLDTFKPQEVVFGDFVRYLENYVDKYNKEDKFYFVAQNTSFDYGFLKSWFEYNQHKYMGSYFHYHLIDLIPISMILKLSDFINPKSLKLEEIAAHLGLRFEGQAHDALADVRMLRAVFMHYIKMLKKTSEARQIIKALTSLKSIMAEDDR